MAQRDKYFGQDVQLSDPANEARVVVPSEDKDFTEVCRSIYVGSGGDVTMLGSDDDVPRVWKNVPSGAILPFRCRRVLVTGTTAADMLALY